MQTYIVRFRFDGRPTYTTVAAQTAYQARLLAQAQFGIKQSDVISVRPA